MIKIKYNNQETYEEVSFSKLGEHIVSLKGATKNNSGFKTYRMSGEQLGDFSDYTTTYRLLDDGIQYSNDGSVCFVTSEDDKQEPTEPTEPTWKESIEAQVLYTAMMTDTLIEGE